MASSGYLAMFVVIIAVSIIPMISATEFIVGDDKGWSINFDSQAWVQGKEFHVGDKLVFKYPKGVHNVLGVNGTGFQQCMAPASTVPLSTGNDEIVLSSSGRKWYICGISTHCETGGMKLAITVITESSLSLSPSPSPSVMGSSPASLPADIPVSATTATSLPFSSSSWIMVILCVFSMVVV